MEIRTLRYFLMAAREQNITRAAERLHIAQPSLSRQLIELEQELGKPLFIRGKRSLTLTEEGVFLRKRAEEIVSLAEKTQREIQSDSAELSGQISIGGAATKKVLRTAAALRAEHPGVQFEFYSSDAASVLERLDHGSLDLAVLLEPADSMKYEYLSLKESARWGLLMPAGCPLAEKAAVRPEDLGTVPLIIHRRIGLRRELACWARTGLSQLNIAASYNVTNGDPIHFAQSGLGCFLTRDDLLSDQPAPGVCFRPLDPPLEARYAMIWKRDVPLSRAADAFLRLLSENAK